MPKLHEYLFVFSEMDGSFPERLRVVKDANDTDLPDSDELTGTVDKNDIDARRTELARQYPAPEFRVATSWANTWGAVQRNYAGLDYEYDSPDGHGSGPRTDHSPFGKVLLETSADKNTKIVFLLGALLSFGVAVVLWRELAPHYGSVFGWALTVLHNPVYGAPSLILPLAFVAGVVSLYWFVYYARVRVTVLEQGIELEPGNRFVPWEEVEHVWFAQRALRYSGVALPRRRSLKLQVRGERPIRLPHRFHTMDDLVLTVLEQVQPVILARAEQDLRTGGSAKFGKQITIAPEHLALNDLGVAVPLAKIGRVEVAGGTFQITNADGHVIFSKAVESIPDAAVISSLVTALKQRDE